MKKIIFIVLMTVSLYAENNETEGMSFIDKEDGMLDASEYLSTLYGFLPVPIIITEPAIGYGGGLGLLYFHDKFIGQKSASGRSIPTSITGIFAAATENGTKMGGLVHMGYYLEDSLRTVTFAVYSNINIDTYVTKHDLPIAANMNGPIFYQAVKYRIQDTGLFLGAGYIYSSLDYALDAGTVTIDPIGPNPPKDVDVGGESSANIAAAQLVLEYDTRDNTLSPSSGYFVNFKANFFSEAVGGDSDFQRYMLKSFFYFPLTEKWNVNLNISGDSMGNTDEETPFYTYPFINLRGLPIMAVQGEHDLASELEICYDLTKRWEALVFGGAGKAFGETQIAQINKHKEPTSFNNADTYYTGGVGFRYLVAKKLGLKVGVDIATSKIDNAFYIQIGSAWAGF